MSDLRNVSSNPHIRAKDTTSRIMLTVVIALLLPAFFGIYNFGFRALVLILISIATCVLTEYIYEKPVSYTHLEKDTGRQRDCGDGRSVLSVYQVSSVTNGTNDGVHATTLCPVASAHR